MPDPTRPDQQDSEAQAKDQPLSADSDPTATEHPTGHAQAAENADNEPPG